MMTQQPSTTPNRLTTSVFAALALLLTLVMVPLAQADEIQTHGLWVPNVAIQNIANGKITYLTNLGSEVDIPLTDVQGIKVPAYPDLWLAQEAISKKDDAKALPLLLKVQNSARQDWLKNHAAWLKIHVLDRMGRTPQAIEAYLALARDKADSYYLQRPPLVSLPKASDAQKKDLAQRLTQSLPDFDGIAKAAIQAMIQRLSPGTPGTTGAQTATPTDSKTTDGTAKTPTSPIIQGPGGIVGPDSKSSGNQTNVVFSSFLADANKDPVTPLLYAGKWQEAVDKCQELLKGPETRMSMRLYQLGMAQLQLAEKSGSNNDYMTAGLSFSRSVIYFPTSSICGPCLVELGYIHQKINRTDLALKLWDKASLQVDETRDPQVFERLEKLISQASSSSSSSDTNPQDLSKPANP